MVFAASLRGNAFRAKVAKPAGKDRKEIGKTA
jgi:hypothetical protein